MIFELIEAVHTAISDSPVRGSKPKSQPASVWIPRSSTGYIILTCPECLRSFSVMQPKAEPDTPSAGAMVRPPGKTDSNITSHDRIKQSEATISASKEVVATSREMFAKKKRK